MFAQEIRLAELSSLKSMIPNEKKKNISTSHRYKSYLSQFQAYSREFDPLNSIEVDEQVNDISWMKPQGNYLKLLTMNCKNIKLWKIYEKPEKKIIKSAGKQLTIPKLHTV